VRAPRLAVVAAGALGVALIGGTKLAEASGPRAHGQLGASHAVGAPQANDFGIGGAGALSGELPLASIVSVEGQVGAILLSPKEAPPGKPGRSLGTVSWLTAGARFHPLASLAPSGPWLGVGAGLAFTGSSPRVGGNAQLGWDFLLGEEGQWCVGPFAAYTHVLEPGTKPAESDAHILWGGVQISFGAGKDRPPPPPPPVADLDGDGVPDAEDACSTVKGIRTNDLNTNGCPEGDTDGDGVPNAEDACPQSKGERRADPKTNGCPTIVPKPDDDRDHDTIPSSVDACPDEPGQPSSDPAKNGCPAPPKPPDAVDELD
jgi:hypothetical protein